MRVKVSEIDAVYPLPWEAGDHLRALVAPALSRGEEIILDFEGVTNFSAVFFTSSVFLLVKDDPERRVPDLLRCENILPHGQGAFESALEYGVRCRDNPRLAEAYYEAARKFTERD